MPTTQVLDSKLVLISSYSILKSKLCSNPVPVVEKPVASAFPALGASVGTNALSALPNGRMQCSVYISD